MEPSGQEGPIASEPNMNKSGPGYGMAENDQTRKMDFDKLANEVNAEFDVIKYCYDQKLFTQQQQQLASGSGYPHYPNQWNQQRSGEQPPVDQGANSVPSWPKLEPVVGPKSDSSYNSVVKNEALSIPKPPEESDEPDERNEAEDDDGPPVPDMLSCGICGKQFTQKISLTIHMRAHTGEKPFECETCGQRFADNLILKSHKRTHIGERPYICTKCGKCFSQKSTLIAHEKVHTGEQLHACQFCGREFLEQSSLTKHARMHENNAMYNVMQSMQMKNRTASQVTSSSALGDFDPVKYCYEQNLFPGTPDGKGGGEGGSDGSPHEASVRKRSRPVEDDAKKDSDRFEQRWKKLKPENKRHANDGAEKNSEFIEHWNKQITDMNNQVGDYSNRSFDFPKYPTEEDSNMSNMSKSMDNEASKDSTEQDSLMSKETSNDNSLLNDDDKEDGEDSSYDSSNIISHLYRNSGLSQQHLNPFRCEICDKRFAQKMSLTVHMKSHVMSGGELPHECDICGRRFADILILKAHENTHTGERPFVCTTCGKCFSQRSTLSVHQKVHTGEGLYTCQFCGKDFLKKYNLNKHLKVHSGDKAPKGGAKAKAGNQSKAAENNINSDGNVQAKPVAGAQMNQQMNQNKDAFDPMKYCYDQKLIPGGAIPNQAVNDLNNKPENGDANNATEKAQINDEPLDLGAAKGTPTPDSAKKDGGSGKFDVKEAFPGSYDSLGRFSHIYGNSASGLSLMYPDVKMFRCEICDEKFTEQTTLTAHMQGHAGDRPLECDICGERFADKLILRSHKRVHATKKPFTCTLCGEGFSQFSEFNLHQMTHMNDHYMSQYGGQNKMAENNGGFKSPGVQDTDGDKGSENEKDSDREKSDSQPTSGEVMNKTSFYPGVYGRPGTLSYNAGKIDKKENNPLFPDIARPFKCEICDRRFAQKISLTVHLRGHTGEKPFECETCGKRFADNLILKAHKRTHTGERPFVCMTCGKGFSQRSTLSVHLKSHTGEKLHACEYCGKEFSKKSALTKHLRIHTGEKPYECHVCKRLFTQDYSLTVHLRLHSGEKPFQCHICEKKFTTNTNLRRHMVVHKDVLGATGPDGSPLAKAGSPAGKTGPAGSGKTGSDKSDKSPKTSKAAAGVKGPGKGAGIAASDLVSRGSNADIAEESGSNLSTDKPGLGSPSEDPESDTKVGKSKEADSDFQIRRPPPHRESESDSKAGDPFSEYLMRRPAPEFNLGGPGMGEQALDFKMGGPRPDFKMGGFGTEFTVGVPQDFRMRGSPADFRMSMPTPDFRTGGYGPFVGAAGFGMNQNPYQQWGLEGSNSEGKMEQRSSERDRPESNDKSDPDVIVKTEPDQS